MRESYPFSSPNDYYKEIPFWYSQSYIRSKFPVSKGRPVMPYFVETLENGAPALYELENAKPHMCFENQDIPDEISIILSKGSRSEEEKTENQSHVVLLTSLSKLWAI